MFPFVMEPKSGFFRRSRGNLQRMYISFHQRIQGGINHSVTFQWGFSGKSVSRDEYTEVPTSVLSSGMTYVEVTVVADF